MINCKTVVNVKERSAEQVFDWIVKLNQERYLLWHPDHIRYEVRKRNESYLGSVVYYEQEVGRSGENFHWQVVEVVENERILYKAQFIYPIHLLLEMKDTEHGVEITHDLQLGYVGGIISRLLDGIVKRFMFTEQDQKINDEHVKEEFKILEKLI